MIAAALLLLLGIVLILAIIAANGYFVAQEFAYMSVDRSRLRALAESGDAAARRALEVTRRTSFMLSGAQLGITVTGLLVGYVAEPLVGESLGTLLGGVGVPAAVSVTIGTVLALVLATVVQMIFGELYPKNLAIASPEPLAKGLARSTLIYLTVLGWLIAVFDKAAEALLRLMRIEPVHDLAASTSPEELRRSVADSRGSGHLSAELSMLIDRVIDFPDDDVEHAMVPRPRVDAVSHDAPIADVRRMMATGHTRYPVVDAADQPVGVVEMMTVLRHDPRSSDDTVATIMREPVVVPTLMALPDALRALADAKHQLACVVDEYGGFAGILTVEDVAEELVGDLTDEHDSAPREEHREVEDGVWLMDGDMHIDEARRVIGHALPSGDYETLAGLVIAVRGALPAERERVTVDLPADPTDILVADPPRRALEIDIVTVDQHVPSRLRVRLVEPTGRAGAEGGRP